MNKSRPASHHPLLVTCQETLDNSVGFVDWFPAKLFSEPARQLQLSPSSCCKLGYAVSGVQRTHQRPTHEYHRTIVVVGPDSTAHALFYPLNALGNNLLAV